MSGGLNGGPLHCFRVIARSRLEGRAELVALLLVEKKQRYCRYIYLLPSLLNFFFFLNEISSLKKQTHEVIG